MGKNSNGKQRNRYFYAGITAFLVVAACVLFFFILFRMSGILTYFHKLFLVLQPVIIGLIIAYLVNPIANLINGRLLALITDKKLKNENLLRKIFNGISVFCAVSVFVIALILIFYLVVPQFVEGISNMINVVPGQIDNITNWTNDMLEKNKDVEDVFISILDYEKNWLQNDLTKYVNSWATYFASGVWNVVTFVKNFAVGLIFAIYILFNKQLLAKQGRKIMFACMKTKTVQYILYTARKSHKIFSGFIYGKLLDSLIIGILCFIGISILKIPYTMLVAVTIGVTNIIPVFGPYLGAIPCAALILLTSPVKGLYFIIFIILLQALDGNFIGPKILGNSTGLSAFWVVFAIVLGGGMFGVLGMLIGVPVFAVIYYIITTLVNHIIRKKQLPVDSDFYDSQICDKLKHKNDELQVEIPFDTDE